MSSFVSQSGREAILKGTDPTTENATMVMQVAVSPPPGPSISPGQPRPPHGQESPISQVMATTTTPPLQQALPLPTAHCRQSLAPDIPISYTMAKLTRQPSPPLTIPDPNPPKPLAPHQHRALTETIGKTAQNINITTTTPLAFLDHVSHIHNNLFTIPTLPLPLTLKATIYDKLTLLPLLFHNNSILLLIPPRSTNGYKPPTYTYNAEVVNSAMSNCTVTQILQRTLMETLRLHTKRTFMPLVQPIHEPCFGPRRLPGQSVDIWILAQIFELLPVPDLESLEARFAQGRRVMGNGAEGAMGNGARRATTNAAWEMTSHEAGAAMSNETEGAISMGMGQVSGAGIARIRGWGPRLHPNPEKVQVMRWFDANTVKGSREIDGLTKRILLLAFQRMRKVERDVDAAMSML